MSIDFPCSQCGKLLRVGDEAAGSQARCPSCGTVQGIPYPSTPVGEGMTGAAQSESPFGPAVDLGSLPPLDPANPYASPMTLAGSEPSYGAGEYWGPRNGPPWERDGASLNSFWATIKSMYSSPQLFFREMRREGGLSAPLLFAMAGAVAGGLATVCYQAGFQAFMFQVVAANQRPGAGAPINPAMSIPVMVVVWLIFIPIGVVMQSFVGSGVNHVCLMIVGGARQAYETTFRVVCYSNGSAALFGLIPICGPYIQGILGLVFTGIGLAYAHETTGGKATLAVLLPVIVCCGAAISLYAAIIGFAIANAR